METAAAGVGFDVHEAGFFDAGVFGVGFFGVVVMVAGREFGDFFFQLGRYAGDF